MSLLKPNRAPVETGAQLESRPTVGQVFSLLRAFSPIWLEVTLK
jgi:hypothetical protein